ncbi:MAG: hypothetical protein ACRD6W_07010 [Nitrososphaerales archaeon]
MRGEGPEVGGNGGQTMRIPIRRLLVVGGGAAILATAGFAYLASNDMPASSSIGEGTVTATGYTVGTISWDAVGCQAGYNGTSSCTATNTAPYYVEGLSFPLTSIADTAPGNGLPNQIVVTLTYPNGTVVTMTGYNNSPTYTPPDGLKPSTQGACSIGGLWSNNWHIGAAPAATTGSGTVTCSVYIGASGEPSIGSSTSATDTVSVDIEANQ